MTMQCQICQHSKKLEIDRQIVSGRTHAAIGREFSINPDAIRNHADHHISRQLAKAWDLKQKEADFNLLNEIDEILVKAKAIFERNYAKGHDVTAIKALAEHRSTMDLLARISYSLHQAKLAELEASQQNREEVEQAALQQQLQVLTFAELKMLNQIQIKLEKQDKNMIIIPDPNEITAKKPKATA